MITAIALRNLFRNRRRTLLSLAIVSVGVVSLLLTLGFVRYSFDGLSEAIIRGGLAHLEIAPAIGMSGGNPLTNRSGSPPEFREWRDVRARVERRPGVRAVSAVIQMAGVLMNGERSVAFTGAALEPARQRRMGIDVKLRGGTGLSDNAPAPGEDQVLLGIDLALALDAAPGDAIVAMVGTASGSLNAIDLYVAGVFTTGLQELDASIAQMHLATAQWLLGSDYVTALLVGLEDGAATEETARLLREDLKASGETLAVTSWEARAPFYRQVRGLYIGIFVFLGTIIGLLVALSTSNTFQMSVFERVREFGALLAMGTDRRQLARLLVMEAMWLAILGGFVGSALTVMVAWAINLLAIEMPPPPGAVDPITLSVLLRPFDFVSAIALMLMVLMIATIPPAMQIFRLRVVEALSHV